MVHLHLGLHEGPSLQVPAGGWACGSHWELPRELCARGKNLDNLEADLPLMFLISSMWQ